MLINVSLILGKVSWKKRSFSFVGFNDCDPIHKCVLEMHSTNGKKVDLNENLFYIKKSDTFRKNNVKEFG